MNKKILFVLLSAVAGATLLPAMAISQNQTKSLCQELNDLRAQSVSALVTTFQGSDTLEQATQLLRQTSTNPAAALRFDRAVSTLAKNPEHQQRLANITNLELSPHARTCPGVAQSRFIAPESAEVL